MKLPISFVAQPPPIRADDDGVLRVGGTRVRLETIINSFKSGSAAEAILLNYLSLNLTDIYAIITYYLWSREEVETILRSVAVWRRPCVGRTKHGFRQRECVSACWLVVRLRYECCATFSAADEDFDNDIVRGTVRRLPTMNIVRAQDVGLSGALDH